MHWWKRCLSTSNLQANLTIACNPQKIRDPLQGWLVAYQDDPTVIKNAGILFYGPAMFRQTPEVTTAFRLSWKQLNSTRAQGMQQNLKPGNLWQFRFTNKVFKSNSGGGQGHASIVSVCKIFPVFLLLITSPSRSFFLSLSLCSW